jgi:hypothetical protein
MTVIEILGTDDDWRSTEYRAERVRRGEWRCRQRDERFATLRETVVGSKREARATLRQWGATKLDECPEIIDEED